MQRPQSSPSSSCSVLPRSLGALGAALLATTVFACSDVLDDLEALRADVERAANAPDAGPTRATPSRTPPDADAPASEGDARRFAEDAPAPESDARDAADAAPASEGGSSPGDAPNRGSRICINACEFAFDGQCDDGRPGSATALCKPNMDCADCGSSLPSVPPS